MPPELVAVNVYTVLLLFPTAIVAGIPIFKREKWAEAEEVGAEKAEISQAPAGGPLIGCIPFLGPREKQGFGQGHRS